MTLGITLGLQLLASTIIMLSVILLTVAHPECHGFNVMLAVLMLSVVMPSVVAPLLMADFCVIFDNQEIMLQNFCSYLFEQKS